MSIKKPEVSSKHKNIKLFEAFSGLGSQHIALNNISKKMKWNIELVGIIEWFIPAIIAYEAIHHPTTKVSKETFYGNVLLSNDSKKPLTEISKRKYYENSEYAFWINRSKKISNNLFDITKVKINDLPKNIDIFTYSFPCQDLSGQGKGKGMEKDSMTRSGLLWEVDRIISGAKDIFKNNEMPKYLLLENVKSIINKNHIFQYKKWLDKLETLGYESKEYILNSKDFGMCQSRERVYLLSVLKDHKKKMNFEFKEINKNNSIVAIKTILESGIEFIDTFKKYKLSAPTAIVKNIKKYKLENYTNFSSENMIFDINYNGPTLTASGALSRIKLFYSKDNIRIMTPRESFRYMGFTDKDFNKVLDTDLISNNKLVYLAGNSIATRVLEELFKILVF